MTDRPVTDDERRDWIRRLTEELATMPPEDQATILETMRDYLNRKREKA
jgi:hypothetical protein